MELTFRVNIHAMFYLAKAAVPHMQPGSAIINTASINSDQPNPTLLAYATTKGAISNFTAGLAQLLAKKSIPSTPSRRDPSGPRSSLDLAGGGGRQVRREYAAEAARSAGGACLCLRHARGPTLELHHRSSHSSDRRPAHA